MRVIDRNLNAWQTGILIFILLFANKIIVLPSLLFEGAGLESIFMLVFVFMFEIGLIWLFYILKKRYPNKSFASVLQKHFGEGVKVLFFAAFCIFFLSKAVLLYNVTYIFFRNLIYKDTSNFLILFCFLPIINHLAISGLRSLGRTAHMFFPVIAGILIFCLVVGIFGIDSRPLLFSNSFESVVLTGLRHIAPFGDMIFLFAFMDKIEVKKGQWKVIFSFAGAATILIVAVNLIFMLSYTYTSFMHPYAIFEIMSFVKEFGGLGRIDIISMVLIIVFAYFHLAIYLKTFMLSFHQIFPKIDNIYSILTFDFVFVVIVTFFIVNLETAVVYGEQILPWIAIFSFLILPVFVFVALLSGRRKKKTKFSLEAAE